MLFGNNVDAQRGSHAFERSIDVLRQLNVWAMANRLRFTTDVGLQPVGAGLPPPQDQLEQDYRRELAGRYGVVFNRLITITNMPIGRFLNYLQSTGKFETTWKTDRRL